jgi:hypothetical protein
LAYKEEVVGRCRGSTPGSDGRSREGSWRETRENWWVDEVSKEVMHCNPNDGRKREQRAPVPEIEGVDEDFFGQLLGMPRETQIPT